MLTTFSWRIAARGTGFPQKPLSRAGGDRQLGHHRLDGHDSMELFVEGFRRMPHPPRPTIRGLRNAANIPARPGLDECCRKDRSISPATSGGLAGSGRVPAICCRTGTSRNSPERSCSCQQRLHAARTRFISAPHACVM